MPTKTDPENIGPSVAAKLEKCLSAALEKGDELTTGELQTILGSTSRPTIAKYRKLLKSRYDDLFAGVITPQDGAQRPLVSTPTEPTKADVDDYDKAVKDTQHRPVDKSEVVKSLETLPVKQEFILIDDNGLEADLEVVHETAKAVFFKKGEPDKVVEVSVKGKKYTVNYTKLLKLPDHAPTVVPDVNAGKLKVYIELA